MPPNLQRTRVGWADADALSSSASLSQAHAPFELPAVMVNAQYTVRQLFLCVSLA